MTAPHLHLTYTIPDGFLEVSHQMLDTILPGPTLLELQGKLKEPLFVSVLLHGNEPTGIKAVQLLLKKYANKELPRSLSIFVGNIIAAKDNLRRLEDQPDYNRIWPGTELPESPETKLANQVYELMQERKVFASIDIHNNTGLNPHYACINRLDYDFLKLAALFGRLVVHFVRPKGVQAAAFARLCPAVTLECGRSDQQLGISHALDYLENCLHLTAFPQHAVRPQDIDLFHTVAQVKIAGQTSFSFNDREADLLLNTDIERMNFTEIPAGTVFGTVKQTGALPVIAQDENAMDISSRFFCVEDNNLQIIRPTMPSMLTLNEKVIQQDCLCYLMERIHLPQTEAEEALPATAVDV